MKILRWLVRDISVPVPFVLLIWFGIWVVWELIERAIEVIGWLV